MMKNVLELIRVSTENQAGEDRAGIPAQRESNRRTAKAYDLNILRSIEIVDVSGSAVLRSPEMQDLLRAMESPGIHGVVAKEFSRLMRPENFNDYALLQHFIDTKTILYLPDGPLDFSSKTGRLIGSIRAAMAGLERRDILERMQDAKEAMRSAGKHPGGNGTLARGIGYSKQRGWHYTDEIESVKHLFRLFIEGTQTYEKLAELTGFARSSITKILTNPVYSGWMVYDEKRDMSPSGYVPRPDGRQGHRKKIARAPDEVIRVQLPLEPIVTSHQFELVQSIIEQRRRSRAEVLQRNPHKFTYNGFLLCGDCGCNIYSHVARDHFYFCRSKHPRERRMREGQGLHPCNNRYMLRDKLEPAIDALLTERITDPTFLCPLIEQYLAGDTSRTSLNVSEANREARLAFLRNKRARILDTYHDGVTTKEERDSALAKVDAEIARIAAMEPNDTQSLPKADDVVRAVATLAEWPFLGREDRRLLLKDLIPEIYVYRYDIKGITLNLSCDNAHRSKMAK